MNSRAFFSVFVGAFAMIFLISFLYSNSVRYDSQAKAGELAILDQAVSKDWFLVRNALANFASDAILQGIEDEYTPLLVPNCSAATITSITGDNYALSVEAYWDDAVAYMNNQFGTQCDANLDVAVKNKVDNTTLTSPEVRDDVRTFGLLECTRSSTNASLSIRHPFVIRKDIRVFSSPIECDVNVFDRLGHLVNSNHNIPFEKQDVNKAYT